jgi:subtilisin-like proprotein convertase family protein
MKNKKWQVKNSNNRKKNVISTEDKVLLASAKIAASKAVRSSLALGITIKVIRDNEIIAISPDKTIKKLRKLSKSAIDISSLKKGMILERK